MILLLKSYPYHFVRTILSVPFCPIPFCPNTILSIPFCPYHFVRYHFVLEPFRHVGEVGNWPVVLDIILIQPSFLMIGFTMTCLCEIGSNPCCSERLHISVTNRSNSSKNSLRIVVGIGSSEQDLDLVDWICLHSSLSANVAVSVCFSYTLI